MAAKAVPVVSPVTVVPVRQETRPLLMVVMAVPAGILAQAVRAVRVAAAKHLVLLVVRVCRRRLVVMVVLVVLVMTRRRISVPLSVPVVGMAVSAGMAGPTATAAPVVRAVTVRWAVPVPGSVCWRLSGLAAIRRR